MLNKMENPFEDLEGKYHALVNAEGQYSLWPTFVAVPDGWKVAMDSKSREECIAFINETWTDMRPNSLAAAMDGSY